MWPRDMLYPVKAPSPPCAMPPPFLVSGELLTCLWRNLRTVEEYQKRDAHFNWLISDLYTVHLSDAKCLTVISDLWENNIFSHLLFYNMRATPLYKIRANDKHDRLISRIKILKMLKASYRDGCDAYLIFLSNAYLATQLLQFGDRFRLINTRAKYVMFFGKHLFSDELNYLWEKIINVILIKQTSTESYYKLYTIPFPSQIDELLGPYEIGGWSSGIFKGGAQLFKNKVLDLQGRTLNVVTSHHMPSTVNRNSSFGAENYFNINAYSGVEIEILKALSVLINFRPLLLESPKNKNVSLGEPTNYNVSSDFHGTDIILNNLYYSQNFRKFYDLSIPYMTQCFTFITPESTTDHSWKTLILPFSRLGLWIAVIVTLLAGGFLFHWLASFQTWLDKHDGVTNCVNFKKRGTHPFKEPIGSFIYVVGTAVLVALPTVPSGWTLRTLAAWWWIYCLLIAVTYRASMTAILAKPDPKVTIDTLNQLEESELQCGGMGEDKKDFFLTSLDNAGKKIGKSFQLVNNPGRAVEMVSTGKFAFYENVYLLRSTKVKLNQQINQDSSRSGDLGTHGLHIMSECIINMPICLGLKKNSPLKQRIDILVRRIIESGLVEKWLSDAMRDTEMAEAMSANDEVKALMNLKKLYGAFMILSIGYILSIAVLIFENGHWHFVVKNDPTFDKYHLYKFYSSRR